MLDTGQPALSGNALDLFRQGLAAASANQYSLAVNLFNQVLALQSDCYEVCYERGLALEAQGDYVEAIASYERALGLQPPPKAASLILHDKGNAYQYGLGEYRKAIDCYDQALAVQNTHAIIWQNKGNALLYGLSLPEDALHCYDQALQINPDNNLAWRNRGNAMTELRRYNEAIASYDKALELQPDDQVAWHARSMAAEKTGMAYRQPTTNPAFYGSGFGEETFVEGDSDSNIIFTAQFTASEEVTPQGQPLFLVEDDWGRHEILLERDQYTIGRDAKSDICLHSQFVSRHHARLVKVPLQNGDSGYQILDGGSNGKPSTNGLIINGQKCRKQTLQAEDVVVFAPKVRATYRLLRVSPNL